MLLTNSAEGGTSGTTVTAGNSGGASGDAWDTVLSTSGTCAYDNTQAAHGALSLKQATAGTAASIQMQWDTSIASVARVYGRVYYRYSSTTLALDVCRVRSGLSNQVARLTVTATTGLLQLRNGANTTVATSTTALSINTWYRLEFDFRPGGAVTNSASIYLGDSVVPLESISASSSYSTDTDCGQFHVGNLSSTANVGNRWFDDIAISDQGWLGPAAPRSLSALGAG